MTKKLKLKLKLKLILILSLLHINILADTITHNGFTYGTVTSPHTGRIWLDRNLGASRVCTAYNDPSCYGDYYQWGRGTDGHEKSNSSTSANQITLSTNSNKFIVFHSYRDWTADDNDKEIRREYWSRLDGTSICPINFRVPTIVELELEFESIGKTRDYNEYNSHSAYKSFLKLPPQGYRSAYARSGRRGGKIYNASQSGGLCSTTLTDSKSYYRGMYYTRYEQMSIGNFSEGQGVRCIIDNSTPQNQPPTSYAGSNQITYKGNAITLSASNSSDSDGNIISYLWKEGDTVLSNDVNFTKYDFSVGVHTITLKVTDNDNESAESYVIVTINDFPKEILNANGTFTNSIDFLNSKRIYQFTLDEKSRVTIKASSDDMKVAGWVKDINGTRLSGLSNWRTGYKNQFSYNRILESGTYILELYSQSDLQSGDFSFTFDTTIFTEVVAEPWKINIPSNMSITKDDLINIALDIQASNGAYKSTLNVTSNNLPTGLEIVSGTNHNNYKFSLQGKIETVQDFDITLNIKDGDFHKEHKINFKVYNFSINGIIGEDQGTSLVIKKLLMKL